MKLPVKTTLSPLPALVIAARQAGSGQQCRDPPRSHFRTIDPTRHVASSGSKEPLKAKRIARTCAQAEALKEIAFHVGYNHVTNFISAFTARYGARRSNMSAVIPGWPSLPASAPGRLPRERKLSGHNPRLSGGPKSGLYRVGRTVGSEGMTSMMSKISIRRRLVILGLALASAAPGLAPSVAAQDVQPSAWRVECAGDGKSLDCRAIQQMINREDKQLIAQLAARVLPDKSAVLLIQLPLGISLTEPVQLKVDNGTAERYPVQTCTNVGCIVSVALKEPLMAAMRSGTLLKISIQDTSKRTINIDVPLLGFALAFDKAK